MSNKLEHGLPNADDAETVCLGAVFLDQDCMAINVEHLAQMIYTVLLIEQFIRPSLYYTTLGN